MKKHFTLTISDDNEMTVVAAEFFGEHILLGADSQVGQKGLTSQARKLFQHTSLPIAWGFAGDLGVGREFSIWLEQRVWQTELYWQTFVNEVTDALAQFNRVHRQRMRNADAQPTEEDRTSVLIAGYLNGEPELIELTGSGKRYFHREDGFSAIGSGENHFKIAKAAMSIIKGPPVEEMFWHSLAVAASLDPESGHPLYRLKITKQGVLTNDQREETPNQEGI